jgi:hypothetical protein
VRSFGPLTENQPAGQRNEYAKLGISNVLQAFGERVNPHKYSQTAK